MNFNVGFYDFSTDAGMNFQLNRFFSMGSLTKEELTEIGQRAVSFEKWIELFTEAGKQAEEQGNHKKAALCYRAAQFYTLSDAKDAEGISLKKILYEKCMEHYDAYYGSIEELQYERIPFRSGYLPVYYAKPENPKSIIVLHGGYDQCAQCHRTSVYRRGMCGSSLSDRKCAAGPGNHHGMDRG